jgi:hypothetical protein
MIMLWTAEPYKWTMDGAAVHHNALDAKLQQAAQIFASPAEARHMAPKRKPELALAPSNEASK